MILETTQLLNNALILTNEKYIHIYKGTHLRHPSTLWAKSSLQNFEWLNHLGLELCKEYTHRYNKIHKCQSILECFSKSINVKCGLPNIGMTSFALCMPDQYRSSNPVDSYRNYYKNDKKDIAIWTNRESPFWWNN